MIRIFTRPSTRSFSSTRLLRSDPYKLPFDPSLSSSSQSQDLDETLFPQPIKRHNEDIHKKRARLIYQSRHRGTLESDLILSTFAKDYLPSMTLNELIEFDQLMDEPDWDIYYWSLDRKQPPAKWLNHPLLNKLKLHVQNHDKVTRYMPPINQFYNKSS